MYETYSALPKNKLSKISLTDSTTHYLLITQYSLLATHSSHLQSCTQKGSLANLYLKKNSYVKILI